MIFLKRWKRAWQNGRSAPRKELHLIYCWASRNVLSNQRCPYVYVFKLIPIPNGDAIPVGVARGRTLREFVHKNVLWKSASGDCVDTAGQNLVPLWDQIIPSDARLPTHRLEMGIMKKGSTIPRSPFFNEYFCFLPLNGKDSDAIAVKIAGFLSSRLKETRNFNGESLNSGKTYWLIAVMAAWKQLS